MKDIRFKGLNLKNTARKEVKGMKRLNFATLGLLIVAVGSLLILSSARTEADEWVPTRSSFTVIEYHYDNNGVIIGKTVTNTTEGINQLGETFTVISETVYRCTDEDGNLLGKAYAESMTVTSTTEHADGSWSETIDEIDYTRDWNTGMLTGDGAAGYRTSISYDAEKVETTKTEGTLNFTIFNNQAEVDTWDFESATLGGEKTLANMKSLDTSTLDPESDTDLLVYSEGTTEYEYMTIRGATKTESVTTTSDAWSWGDGTLPDGTETAACPLDGATNYAWTTNESVQINGYDAWGNFVGTPDAITIEGDVFKINGEAATAVEVLNYVKDNGGSINVNTANGIRHNGESWAVYNQGTVTTLEEINGSLKFKMTGVDYHNSVLQGNASTYVDPEFEGEIIAIVHCEESITYTGANNDQTAHVSPETVWVFIRTEDGEVIALKFEADYEKVYTGAGGGHYYDMERDNSSTDTQLLDAFLNGNLGVVDSIHVFGDQLDVNIFQVNTIFTSSGCIGSQCP